MHNIKKTPANEAYIKAENKRREEKLNIYMNLRNLIFSKKEKGEFDEQILSFTAELLKKNPDIYTFWNIRRKAIFFCKNKNENELDKREYDNNESERDKKESDNNESKIDKKELINTEKLFNDELLLTKNALLTNPKSYSAWHHRYWAICNDPSADLLAELELCNNALSLDGRNFHCWDYRRAIVKLANLSDDEELKFSDNLITENPSNYSAWHYRAILLPRIRPDLNNDALYKMPISEDCLQEEFDKSIKVCSFNSEDQTAWTYLRWLCEASCKKVDDEDAQIISVEFVDDKNIKIVFSKPVRKNYVSSIFKDLSNLELQSQSKYKCPVVAEKFQYAQTWTFATTHQKIVFNFNNLEQCVSPNRPFKNKTYLLKLLAYSKCSREVQKKCLENLIEVCEKLIKIDKEEIPWEVIALARAKLFLTGPTPETVKEIDVLYEKVKLLDPQRKAMYEDLMQIIKKNSIDFFSL